MRNLPILGVPAIDREHKEIVFFLAQIQSDKDNIPKILDAFTEYLLGHLQREETLMQVERYPSDLQAHHINEHRRIQTLYMDSIGDRLLISAEQIDTLGDGIIRHIDTFDRALAEWIKGGDGRLANEA